MLVLTTIFDESDSCNNLARSAHNETERILSSIMMFCNGRMRSSMASFSVVITVGMILLGCGSVEATQTTDLIYNRAEADAAVELNMNNFNATLWAAPAAWVLVEFSANWSPACRNYKPQYEKVARLFNGQNAVHPGTVFMTKVDCGLKINTKLCDRFSVSHYPFLLWGEPSKFAYGSWEINADSGIESIENARTAELLLKWINKKIGKSYNLDDKKFENELIVANASAPVKVTRAIDDV